MEQRGRKSSASLAVISPSGIATIGRPEPLERLTDSQATVWTRTVNRMPADWFPAESWPMLGQYCRHIVEADRIAALIERLVSGEEFNVQDYDKLLHMQERESRAAASLATRMRMTQQSTYSDRKSTGTTKGRKPWETGKA